MVYIQHRYHKGIVNAIEYSPLFKQQQVESNDNKNNSRIYCEFASASADHTIALWNIYGNGNTTAAATAATKS